MKPKIVNPPSLGPPIGYSHGVQVGHLLFVSGQVGAKPTDENKLKAVSCEFVPQFESALDHVLEVVKAAGGDADSLVEMTVFVKDMDVYRRSRAALGEAWKCRMGHHYPAMTLVEVSDLFEPGTLVEIRAVAALG